MKKKAAKKPRKQEGVPAEADRRSERFLSTHPPRHGF
jgi:hypothetical protein